MRYAHTNRDAKKRAVALIAGNAAKMVTVPVFEEENRLVTLASKDWEIR